MAALTRERKALGTLIVLILILSLGFIVHRSPRFPGSLAGGVLGVSGAALMVLVSLAYMAIKRIPALKVRVSKRVAMRTLITWHVYTSAFGAILALLHTGHRFESNLGIALTTMMLLTTLSGYVGAELLGRVALKLREKQQLLATLENAYNLSIAELSKQPELPKPGGSSIFALLRARLAILTLDLAQGLAAETETPAGRAVRLARSIAELEYAIRTHARNKRLAALWLKLHISTALAFYALLGLHIWAGIYFGLRWFQ